MITLNEWLDSVSPFVRTSKRTLSEYLYFAGWPNPGMESRPFSLKLSLMLHYHLLMLNSGKISNWNKLSCIIKYLTFPTNFMGILFISIYDYNVKNLRQTSLAAALLQCLHAGAAIYCTSSHFSWHLKEKQNNVKQNSHIQTYNEY